MDMYEREFQDDNRKCSDDAMDSCMFLMVTCLGGMRGFEAISMDLSVLRYDFGYCETDDYYSAI